MNCRAGITTRPADRKAEWKKEYPNMHNWKIVPFKNLKAAQDWENNQLCYKSKGYRDPDLPDAKWYGYRFEF